MRQDRGGAGHRLRQNGRDITVVLLVKRRVQFLRRHRAALRQNRIALHTHCLRFDERLGIVVVILEAEQLHELHTLSGKHFGLAGCQHCRNRKVIRIFYFRQFGSSLMRRRALRPI